MKKYFGVFLKGTLMGAADVVPGVSGGTIAFITGIYEEFINSLKNLNLSSLKTLKNKGLSEFWKDINGNFLAALFLGIFTSLLSLAKLITYTLETHPIPTWAFFFGLIVASAVYIGKQIGKWKFLEVISIVIAAAIAYFITIAPAVHGNDSLLYIFLSGSIAICAMILPGISGSFILLLMGSYPIILGAISNLTNAPKENIIVILVFGLGAIIGLISFSKVISIAFEKAKSITMAILTGFMIGSLNKVWPWKKIIDRIVDRHGNVKPILEKSVSPSTYTADTGLEANVNLAIGMALLGIALIVVMAYFDKQKDLSDAK